jgi:hypothetical protein
MDFESKEERSIGTLVSRKTEEKYQSNLTEERIEGTAMSEVEKAVKSPSRGEGVEFPDGTESEVTTKIPHSVDTDYDPSQAVFVNPDEGTPAAEALAGNSFQTFLPEFSTEILFLLLTLCIFSYKLESQQMQH